MSVKIIPKENLQGLLKTIRNIRSDLAEGQVSIADFQLNVIENNLENYIEKEKCVNDK